MTNFYDRERAECDLRSGQHVVEPRADHRAERRTDEQDRCQRPARGARAEGEPPGDQLADGERRDRSDGEAFVEHVADRVVTHAEGTRHEQPHRGEADGTDRRMPERAHR